MGNCKVKDCTNEVRAGSPEDICNYCIGDLNIEGLIDIEPDSEYPSTNNPSDIIGKMVQAIEARKGPDTINKLAEELFKPELWESPLYLVQAARRAHSAKFLTIK